MEKLTCSSCGSDELKEKENGIYVCANCNAKYVLGLNAKDSEYIISHTEKALWEQTVAKIEKVLFNLRTEVQREYLNDAEIVHWCRELKKLIPDHFLASFYEVAISGTPKQINAYLNSTSKENCELYADYIAEFMLRSLESSNVLPLKDVIARGLKDEKYIEYITKVEDEAERVKSGIYSPQVPRDVFVAYSSKDYKAVNEIVEILEENKITCFVAQRNLRHGKGAVENYANYLKIAMHNCKCVVFISSDNSRDLECDALKIELPYIRDNEPKMGRIEYLLSEYGKGTTYAAKLLLEDFFSGLEYCRSEQDLIKRILGYITGFKASDKAKDEKHDAKADEVKYCLNCGEKNPIKAKLCMNCGSTEFADTYEKYIEIKTERELRKRLEEERKRLEAEYASKLEAERNAKEQAERELKAERKIKEEAARHAAEAQNAKKQDARKVNENARKRIELPLEDFEIENGVLKKYKGKGGDVVIPSGVTRIEYYAFDDCDSLTSIEIPDSVTSIGYSAFSSCNSLTSINIPNSVTSIGNSAFSYCAGLTSIKIPNSVTRIEDYAFQGCESLTSIKIPNSVTSIGVMAFDGCESLTSIEIPNSVTRIEDYAFQGCESLTSIKIPNSVTNIGRYAFSCCNSLTSIEIPDSVTSIGAAAFSGCNGLTNLIVAKGNKIYHSAGNCIIETESKTLIAGCNNSVIPADGSVTSIVSAFYGCKGLTSIEIPNSVTSIGGSAFSSCDSLTNIEIPNSVTSIGYSAFYGCVGLTSIEIPDSVTSIGDEAFRNCRSLTSIRIPNSVTSIGAGAFLSCKGLTSIEIPNSVTSIGNSAFSHCNGLTSIKIPNSVTSIGRDVFSYCDNLKVIYCQALKRPKSWSRNWKKECKAKVVWGYKGDK